MATIDDNLAKTVTEAFRQAQIDISNQDKLLVGPGDVTLTRADGTTFTGPSFPKMAGITTSALQWRGGIPASSNLNNFGPTSAYTGVWGQSSVSATAADIANGYPVAERGVLEVFAGGRNNGTQRYTTDGGRLFIRWLTAAWNAASPAWSDWTEVGGLSSNTVLPAAAGLADAAYFSQNQTYVLSGSRSDLPSGINGNCVIMSVRRQGGTIAGLNQLLFTSVGTYERHGAPNAATGWTSVSWYAGGDANGWRLVGADAMAVIGYGTAPASIKDPFDWQQVDMVTGEKRLTTFTATAWVNTPAGITYNSGTNVDITCLINQANRLVLRLTSNAQSAGNRAEYVCTGTGAKGSRNWTIVQNFNSDSSSVVPVSNGGTGSNTVAGAQTNLGLIKQASAGDATAGRLLTVGAFGLGAINPATVGQNDRIGFGSYLSKMVLGGLDNNVSSVSVPFDTNTGYQLVVPTILATAPRLYLRLLSSDSTNNGRLCQVYTDANTTKAADGTLKAASPIVQIFQDGTAQVNDESEGCTVKRLGVGEYLIEGCIGLNADASWGGIDGGFDIPKDRNRQPLVWLDYEVNADGSVLVKIYHRTHPGAPAFARNIREGFAEGDPIDIPADQFVSVRVEMPADSIYNKKMEEAARIQAERDEAKSLEEEEAARAKAEQDTLEAEAIVEQERLRAEAEAATYSDEQPDVQQ
ncbi:pyocin knob domain-containing protein [Leclercia adecarboxylata]|uniref:pyocin knob domain-containing protein n=1 Tax=Leclercia adecarboxylata TaxID=83655 RepID=UPI00090798BB|nr:pyocin knob domain-containing protein [Leclercia adecarboxylata]